MHVWEKARREKVEEKEKKKKTMNSAFAAISGRESATTKSVYIKAGNSDRLRNINRRGSATKVRNVCP